MNVTSSQTCFNIWKLFLGGGLPFPSCTCKFFYANQNWLVLSLTSNPLLSSEKPWNMLGKEHEICWNMTSSSTSEPILGVPGRESLDVPLDWEVGMMRFCCLLSITEAWIWVLLLLSCWPCTHCSPQLFSCFLNIMLQRQSYERAENMHLLERKNGHFYSFLVYESSSLAQSHVKICCCVVANLSVTV